MSRALVAAALMAALSAPAGARDNHWTIVARDQAGVVVEQARHSAASTSDLSAAVFRFRPTQGDAAERRYAIAANCAAGTLHVAPVNAIATDMRAWLASDVRHASFRRPADRSVGGQIIGALCQADNPAPHGATGITLAMDVPQSTNGLVRN